VTVSFSAVTFIHPSGPLFTQRTGPPGFARMPVWLVRHKPKSANGIWRQMAYSRPEMGVDVPLGISSFFTHSTLILAPKF